MTALDVAPATQRPVGRPREFDMDAALDKAIVVFTERGYHGTSIGDLSTAMGVTSGSLYKAFADKKAIFLAAFDRYKLVRNACRDEAIAPGRNGRERIRLLLHFYADGAHGEMGRRGCLVVGAAVELALFDAEADARVARSQAGFETLFERLVREGQTDGSIGAHIDPPITARLLYAVIQGMRVIGKGGQDFARALSIADAALKILD
ncbi:TetR family transcriptional regulator [Rhizobiales bacterium RZME27]|uniref:TetR family transcriptional regulator n=1 Tax=Endobacterium cereale TaxID=2663029 RepID=A0A6A8A5G3_9HYPH|nr:TetR/AcrR family transcriptional regulator [Endobacterium cereale]MEB2844917.1 TetR/AcrR family transcriptional regulator [Endobacterium cereale]MQY44830.1 TetR family transcriptional regulator [Endobacterium cereale]